MNKTIAEALGWYGVVAILLAYAAISFSIFDSDSLSYHLLNASGAVGIVVDGLYSKNYQPAVLNIFWFAIAFIAIINLLL